MLVYILTYAIRTYPKQCWSNQFNTTIKAASITVNWQQVGSDNCLIHSVLHYWILKTGYSFIQTCSPGTYSVCGRTADTAAELVLGSSAMPPPSRNMVTAISRLLLHASSICFPTLSLAPVMAKKNWSTLWKALIGSARKSWPASFLSQSINCYKEQFISCHLSLTYDYETGQTQVSHEGSECLHIAQSDFFPPLKPSESHLRGLFVCFGFFF